VRQHLRPVLCILALLATGCGAPPPLGEAGAHDDDPPGASRSAPYHGASPPHWGDPGSTIWGFDFTGAPVRFDAWSGATIASGDAKAAVDRDIAVDPFGGEVAVFHSEEGDDGLLQRHALGPAEASAAWPVTGRIELWFGPAGLWLFESGMGKRWRRWRHDGEPESSIWMGMPTSLWRRDGLSVGALVEHDEQVHWVEVASGAGPSPSFDLTLPAIVPQSGVARAAPLSPPHSDHLVVAWPSASGLAFCIVAHDGELVAEWLTSEPGRVRQMTALPGGDRALMLIDGPARLVSVELGDTLSPSSLTLSSLPLAGTLDDDDRVGRRLVRVGSRALVALDQGLVAIDIDPVSLTMTVDPDFDGSSLRAPLATR
jgi:hypothetical protein